MNDLSWMSMLKDFGYPAVMSFFLVWMMNTKLEALRAGQADIKQILAVMGKTLDIIVSKSAKEKGE